MLKYFVKRRAGLYVCIELTMVNRPINRLPVHHVPFHKLITFQSVPSPPHKHSILNCVPTALFVILPIRSLTFSTLLMNTKTVLGLDRQVRTKILTSTHTVRCNLAVFAIRNSEPVGRAFVTNPAPPDL